MICMMCGKKEALFETEEQAGGEYQGMCADCIEEARNDNRRIKELIGEGHAAHCACRQVFGDGECECDLYAKGYDPYAWMNQGETGGGMMDLEEIEKRTNFVVTTDADKMPEGIGE